MPLHSATPADMRDRAPPGHARRCARRPSVLIPGRMEQNRIGRVRNKPARQMWEGPAVGWRRIPFDETRRANIRRESAGSYIRFPYYRYGVGRMPRNGGARRRNELRASPLTFLDVGVGPPVFGVMRRGLFFAPGVRWAPCSTMFSFSGGPFFRRPAPFIFGYVIR